MFYLITGVSNNKKHNTQRVHKLNICFIHKGVEKSDQCPTVYNTQIWSIGTSKPSCVNIYHDTPKTYLEHARQRTWRWWCRFQFLLVRMWRCMNRRHYPYSRCLPCWAPQWRGWGRRSRLPSCWRRTRWRCWWRPREGHAHWPWPCLRCRFHSLSRRSWRGCWRCACGSCTH